MWEVLNKISTFSFEKKNVFCSEHCSISQELENCLGALCWAWCCDLSHHAPLPLVFSQYFLSLLLLLFHILSGSRSLPCSSGSAGFILPTPSLPGSVFQSPLHSQVAQTAASASVAIWPLSMIPYSQLPPYRYIPGRENCAPRQVSVPG